MIEPFPLLWPENQPITENRKKAPFSVSFAEARDGMLKEIGRLGGRDVVITSNLITRQDGLPKAGQPNPKNPGIAVYFWRKGALYCMACDRWIDIKDNLRAIHKTIEAIRGIERWGSINAMEQAVSAFAYLPSGGTETQPFWAEKLGISSDASVDEIQQAYRDLVKVKHPDAGGTHEEFLSLKQAYDAALLAKGEGAISR